MTVTESDFMKEPTGFSFTINSVLVRLLASRKVFLGRSEFREGSNSLFHPACTKGEAPKKAPFREASWKKNACSTSSWMAIEISVPSTCAKHAVNP